MKTTPQFTCKHMNNKQALLKKKLAFVVCMFTSSLLFSAAPLPPEYPSTNDLQQAYSRMSAALQSNETSGEYDEALASIQTSLDSISSKLTYQNAPAAQWLYQIRVSSQQIQGHCSFIRACVNSLTNQVDNLLLAIDEFYSTFYLFTLNWELYFNTLLSYQDSIDRTTLSILERLEFSNINVRVNQFAPEATNHVSVNIGFESGDVFIPSLTSHLWEDCPYTNLLNWIDTDSFSLEYTKWLVLPMGNPQSWTNELLRASTEDLQTDFSSFENAFRSTSEVQAKLLNNVNDGITRLVLLMSEGSTAIDELKSYAESQESIVEQAVANAEYDGSNAFDKDSIDNSIGPMFSAINQYADESGSLQFLSEEPSRFQFVISGGNLFGITYETFSFEVNLTGQTGQFLSFIRTLFLMFYGVIGIFICCFVLIAITRFIFWLSSLAVSALGGG